MASLGLVFLLTAGAVNAQDDKLPGGKFEVGAIVGGGFHASANQLSDCIWFGARVGHRFEPFGNTKFQMGVRTSFEGCYTDHPEDFL